MPYSPNVPAAGSPPKTPPAPWVPFTRAGCNVGDVSTANMVLENVRPDLANFFGPSSPEVAQLNADPDSFSDAEVADYEGIGVHCAQGSSFCSSAQAVKFGQTTPSPTAVADVLPDEPGGYTGFQALFGHKYVAPQLGAGTPNLTRNGYQVTNAAGNLVDLSGNEIDGAFLTNHPGFPGFGPISAAQTLAYTADMLETGVPVVYSYISDAHEKKPGQSNCEPRHRSGPGGLVLQGDARVLQHRVRDLLPAARRRRHRPLEHGLPLQCGGGRPLRRRERRSCRDTYLHRPGGQHRQHVHLFGHADR